MLVLKSKWKTIPLKDPVVFRDGEKQFIIRNVRDNGTVTMCELEMDDDKCMKAISDLPIDVQDKIHSRLKAA